MRLLRFRPSGPGAGASPQQVPPAYGVRVDQAVQPVAGLTNHRYVGSPLALAEVDVLAPVVPRLVVGMAHNTGPADRLLAPQAFLKPVGSVVGPGAAVVIPDGVGVVEPEAELALVIGATCRDLTPDTAAAAVLGWTGANDVTARDLQRTDPLWTRAKGYDTFTPLGPDIHLGMPEPQTTVTLAVDGATVSTATLADLARDPVEILCYLTSFMTLQPGDVVLTGAPGASVPLRAGMTVSVQIGGVAALVNPVTASSTP